MMIGQQAPYGVCSGILQASDAEDKENVCPENNTDWLHKNYNYVRTRQPTSHTSCVPNSLTSHNLFNATATPGAIFVFFHFCNPCCNFDNDNVFHPMVISYQLK